MLISLTAENRTVKQLVWTVYLKMYRALSGKKGDLKTQVRRNIAGQSLFTSLKRTGLLMSVTGALSPRYRQGIKETHPKGLARSRIGEN